MNVPNSTRGFAAPAPQTPRRHARGVRGQPPGAASRPRRVTSRPIAPRLQQGETHARTWRAGAAPGRPPSLKTSEPRVAAPARRRAGGKRGVPRVRGNERDTHVTQTRDIRRGRAACIQRALYLPQPCLRRSWSPGRVPEPTPQPGGSLNSIQSPAQRAEPRPRRRRRPHRRTQPPSDPKRHPGPADLRRARPYRSQRVMKVHSPALGPGQSASRPPTYGTHRTDISRGSGPPCRAKCSVIMSSPRAMER